MKSFFSLFFLFFFSPFCFGSLCTFIPPEGWEAAFPKNSSTYVQVGFVGPGSTLFRPSINLTVEEEVDLSLKGYVKAVKEVHLSDAKTKWRDLGKFQMQAGEGRLTELTTPSAWGEVKMLQTLFVKDKKAYILTAAFLKEDLAKWQKEILASLRSLTLIPDLFAPISDPLARSSFETFFRSLGQFQTEQELEAQRKTQWELLQKESAKHVANAGAYWHYLVLSEGKAKIFSSPNGHQP